MPLEACLGPSGRSQPPRLRPTPSEDLTHKLQIWEPPGFVRCLLCSTLLNELRTGPIRLEQGKRYEIAFQRFWEQLRFCG